MDRKTKHDRLKKKNIISKILKKIINEIKTYGI
jgi:hypothetical protein